MTVDTPDHHSEYLAKAVAELTPDGRQRIDELLEQLAVAGRSREWVVRFALAREAEVDAGRTDTSADEEPADSLSKDELDILIVPDLEAGNMLAKSLSFLADADAAGIVLGARVPIILTSRADSVMTRLASCAVAALAAKAQRETAARALG